MFIMFPINKIPFLVYPDVSSTFFSSLLEVLTVAQMAQMAKSGSDWQDAADTGVTTSSP